MGNSKKHILRLYIAEYEDAEAWMSGNGSAILKYAQDYDLYLVYRTGRKPVHETFKITFERMGDKCKVFDAREMSDEDIYAHIAAQVSYYCGEDTHVYFLHCDGFYQAVRTKITTGVEVSVKPTYRTGRIDVPVSMSEGEKQAQAGDVQPPPGEGQPDGPPTQDKENPASQSGKPASDSATGVDGRPATDTGGQDKPASAGDKKKRGKRPKGQKGKQNDRNKNTGNVPSGIPPTDTGSPMDPFLHIFNQPGHSDAEGGRTAPPSENGGKKAEGTPKNKGNAPGRNSQEGQDSAPEGVPPSKDQKEGTKGKPEGTPAGRDGSPSSGGQTGQGRGAGNPPGKGSSNGNGQGRDTPTKKTEQEENAAKRRMLEKSILGKEHEVDIVETVYTELDDSKARTVALLADRLIGNIDVLVPKAKTYNFSFDAYMELIYTLACSDGVEDFNMGWEVVKPGCALGMDKESYDSLRKEVDYYARTCELLYAQDDWN